MASNGKPPSPDVDTLTADYLHLARALARPYQRRKPWLRDDLESAACYGLFRAALHYEPGGGARFDTFARYFIVGRLRQVYRRPSPVPLPEHVIVVAGGRSDNIPDDPVEEFERLIACVPERQREILRLVYRDGLSHTEAGSRLGMCPSWVNTHKHGALATIAWVHGLSVSGTERRPGQTRAPARPRRRDPSEHAKVI